ncbi:MAG: hypothetical protein J0H15_01865 [Xanthomonadales bacterium]|nr:hypothetical protein [Xanthomonadales bacterium]
MDNRLLDILCCPATRVPVRLLAAAELEALNAAIGAGEDVTTADGTRVGTPLVAGLITRDGRTVYRIEDDIPVMLADEAIATGQIRDFPSP